MPEALESYSNYRVDMVFTYEAANDTGRWGSVMYRTSAAGNTPAHEPYFQFAVRQNAVANNGTELEVRCGTHGPLKAVSAPLPFYDVEKKRRTAKD